MSRNLHTAARRSAHRIMHHGRIDAGTFDFNESCYCFDVRHRPNRPLKILNGDTFFFRERNSVKSGERG
jgi:hypothetical protein